MRRSHREDPYPTVREAALGRMSAAELKRLASLTGGRLPTRKADLVERIVDHLAGDGLRAVWEELDETQRRAVAEVVHSDDSRFRPDRFQAKYGTTPTWGSLDPYRRESRPTPLWFFFYGAQDLPDDLKSRLRQFVPPPEPTTLATVDSLPATFTGPYADAKDGPVPIQVREAERAAPRELLAVLRLIDAGEVSVGPKTRLPSVAGQVAVAGVLEDGDFYSITKEGARPAQESAPGPIRAFAWPLLLHAAKLAEGRGSRLHLTSAGRAALSAPPADTLRVVWRRWLNVTSFDELSRLDVVKGQKGRGKQGLTSVKRRRAAIADALASAPRSRWFEVEAIRRYLRATGSDCRVAHDAWGLYVAGRRYGALGYDGGDRLLDTRYLWSFLFEYAATLGLVDVAFVHPDGARRDFYEHWGTDDLEFFSRYDGLLYVRLTSLGAYCLGLEGAYTPRHLESDPVLKVLPNFEVAALGDEVAPADRLALDAYALSVSERVWRLDARQLLTALGSGRTAAEIREFLTARSATPIPDTVSRLLDDAEARSTAVRSAGSAALLACRDPELAQLVAHDARAGRHCLLAGDRHLAVPYRAQAAFRRALHELGYVVDPAGNGVDRRSR